MLCVKSTFADAIDDEEGGIKTLEKIGDLCEGVTTKGHQLHQMLPSSRSSKSLHTLMLLLEYAVRSNARLERVAREACRGYEGCVVLPPPQPTKSISRALEKVRGEPA